MDYHKKVLLHILDTIDIPREKSLMIGDSSIDIITGRNAGIGGTVAVTYGIGNREKLLSSHPDHVINSFAELLPIVIKEND